MAWGRDMSLSLREPAVELTNREYIQTSKPLTQSATCDIIESGVQHAVL